MKKEMTQKQPAGPANNELQDYNDIFTAQGIKIASAFLQRTKGNANPQKIADNVLAIISRVEAEGKKNGITFPLEAVFTAGRDILTFMLDKLGVQDKNIINQVVGDVVGRYLAGKQSRGELTPEQLQQMTQGGQQQAQAGTAQQLPMEGMPNG